MLENFIGSNMVQDTETRVDKLVMVVRAMWALLEERGYTAEDLGAKLEEIDLEDGVLDGHVRPPLVDCPSCQSKVAPGLMNCQFCGTEVRDDTGHPIGRL